MAAGILELLSPGLTGYKARAMRIREGKRDGEETVFIKYSEAALIRPV